MKKSHIHVGTISKLLIIGCVGYSLGHLQKNRKLLKFKLQYICVNVLDLYTFLSLIFKIITNLLNAHTVAFWYYAIVERFLLLSVIHFLFSIFQLQENKQYLYKTCNNKRIHGLTCTCIYFKCIYHKLYVYLQFLKSIISFIFQGNILPQEPVICHV